MLSRKSGLYLTVREFDLLDSILDSWLDCMAQAGNTPAYAKERALAQKILETLDRYELKCLVKKKGEKNETP